LTLIQYDDIDPGDTITCYMTNQDVIVGSFTGFVKGRNKGVWSVELVPAGKKHKTIRLPTSEIIAIDCQTVTNGE
jgi:hypothetical protein